MSLLHSQINLSIEALIVLEGEIREPKPGFNTIAGL
jgi:hypothetical protein